MDELAGWAQAAREGDPVAVAALVRATQSDVWRLCAHLVDAAEAADLAQETYLRALRSLPSYEARAPFRIWLLGIARRTCMDALRARTRRRALLQRLALSRAESQADPAGTVTTSALIGSLDPDRRAAFVLTQMLGLSYMEAAEVCGVPIGTVRSRVARAREDLQCNLRQADSG
jgi:RNA polymerase sigma-70 factor (ECF subfamily)